MAKEEKPIRQSVHVDCSIEDAFRLFTENFGEWWPSEDDSCFQIEPGPGGRLLEQSPSGDEREAGTVTAWEPPHRVEFTFHPGSNPERAGTVEVEFTVVADGTQVTLIHHDWHLAADLVCFSAFVHHLLVAV